MSDLFSYALDKVDNGVIIIDSNQFIIFWNKYMEKISYLKASFTINRKISDVIALFYSNLYQGALDAVLHHNQSRFFSSKLHKAFIIPENSEYTNIRQNMKIEPITINDNVYALIQISDITNEINHEYKLTSLLSELQKGYEQIKEAEKTNKVLAETDSLTGLSNRYYVTTKIENVIENFEINQFSLFFLDLDGFKKINDTYGHTTGDMVLKTIAKRLQKTLTIEGIVSRFGGDEFVLLIKTIDKSLLSNLAQNLIDDISKPLLIGDLSITITTSIGIFICRNDMTTTQIIEKADFAMYEAKRHGKNRFEFFN